jgi:molecular chaperone DnaK (HSP70)
MTEPILAIDFGTTTSAAIVVAGGKEDLIEEPSGHGRTWPSSVSLDGDRLVAGTAAENRKRRHAQLYRAEIKPELAEDRQVRLGDRDFPVTELITAILAAIRTEAERVAGREVRRAVITVPASYRPHDRRRALMLQAAADAGLAPVELLTEPVAAALAPATGTPIPPGSLLVVYDYGGGTFDTARAGDRRRQRGARLRGAGQRLRRARHRP